MKSCEQSGNDPKHHFVGADNPITSGKERIQMVKDYHLSRFACYLVAQNGDSRKPEIKYETVSIMSNTITFSTAVEVEEKSFDKKLAMFVKCKEEHLADRPIFHPPS